jgi:hypothetical protein
MNLEKIFNRKRIEKGGKKEVEWVNKYEGCYL